MTKPTIIVTSISRGYSELIADNSTVDVVSNETYSVNFFYKVNENIFESSTRLLFEGELFFSKAEELIAKQLTGGDNS